MSLDEFEDLQVENQHLKCELERQKNKPSQILSDSETIQKYKFDNQILMRKLSDYKKAERGAV